MLWKREKKIKKGLDFLLKPFKRRTLHVFLKPGADAFQDSWRKQMVTKKKQPYCWNSVYSIVKTICSIFMAITSAFCRKNCLQCNPFAWRYKKMNALLSLYLSFNGTLLLVSTKEKFQINLSKMVNLKHGRPSKLTTKMKKAKSWESSSS